MNVENSCRQQQFFPSGLVWFVSSISIFFLQGHYMFTILICENKTGRGKKLPGGNANICVTYNAEEILNEIELIK